MPLVQVDFNGSPYLGVFARSNEAFVLVPPGLREDVLAEVQRALGVDLVQTLIGGSTIVGSTVAMNSHGAIVADFADDEEIRVLTDRGLRVERLAGKFNAAGNNILCNDRGALVNPDLGKSAITVIERGLGVPVEKGTLAGTKTVGSSAVVTNKGALCHPKANEEEIEALERLLDLEADIGTVNHGAPYLGAGIVANTRGAIVGRQTTGPELNRIEDALHYI